MELISEFDKNTIQHLPIKYTYLIHPGTKELMSGPEEKMLKQVNYLLNKK